MTWAKAVLWQHGKFQQRATADSGHLRNPTHKNKLSLTPFPHRHRILRGCLFHWSCLPAEIFRMPSYTEPSALVRMLRSKRHLRRCKRRTSLMQAERR